MLLPSRTAPFTSRSSRPLAEQLRLTCSSLVPARERRRPSWRTQWSAALDAPLGVIVAANGVDLGQRKGAERKGATSKEKDAEVFNDE